MAGIAQARMANILSRRGLLPGEGFDVRDDAAAIFGEPDLWLNASDARFGGLSPTEAIRRGRETAVRNLPRQLIHIGMS